MVWPCISDVPENVCDPDELAAFIEDGILVLEYYTVIVALLSIFVSVACSSTGNSPWLQVIAHGHNCQRGP